MNGMGLVLVSVLLSILLFRRSLVHMSRQHVRWYTDPVALFSGAWLIQALAYSLPIFINRDIIEGRHVIYIAICHVAFLLGVLLVRGRKTQNKHDASAEVSMLLLYGIALVGLAGNFFISYDGLSVSRIGLVERFTGDALESIRVERFANSMIMKGGPFASLEFLAAASTVFVCLMAAGVTAQLALKSLHKKLLAVLVVLSVAFVSFNAIWIIGGRMSIVLLLLGSLMAALMDTRRWFFGVVDRFLGRAKSIVFICLGCLTLSAAWYFSTSFLKDRAGETPPLVSLSQYHRAEPTPWVAEAVGNEETLQYALLSFSYITVPLTTLSYYYDLDDNRFPGPFWGQYNFGGPVTFIMRRMGYVRDQKTVNDIRQEATADLRLMGYGDNVWPTILRDFALDVGWIGVPMVMIIFGFLSELAMSAARSEGRFINKILALLTGVLLVFSTAHSLLILENFQKAFWMCFVIIIYQRMTAKNVGIRLRTLNRA